MVAKKKSGPMAKPRGPKSWDEDHDEYPLKKGICGFCGQRDELKLSYDKIRYICTNASACVLRWRKTREKV